jgi:uncharacterized membrane protein YkgB
MNDLRTIPANSSTPAREMQFGLSLARAGDTLSKAGAMSIRYGLVIVIAWIGAMKFTAYEAQGIEGLVANSPLLSWVYSVASVRGFSAALGVVELLIAALIAVHTLFPRLAAFGSLLAVGMFATTLSFLVTTPGVFEAGAGGFPALTVAPGQFLVKDLVLLGASVFLLVL